MKNDGQPIRDSVPWNSQCTKDPRWLKNFFLFSTEIWAEQLKNTLYLSPIFCSLLTIRDETRPCWLNAMLKLCTGSTMQCIAMVGIMGKHTDTLIQEFVFWAHCNLNSTSNRAILPYCLYQFLTQFYAILYSKFWSVLFHTLYPTMCSRTTAQPFNGYVL